MNIQHQYLRMFRKRSPLRQSDIAAIMGLREYSSISRWEKGERSPNIDMLLVYHVLFDIPIENLFKGQNWGYEGEVVERIQRLIEQLKPSAGDRKIAKRISFLESVLTKINPQ
jgi:transcriptional regulator with XRE-family HTH domain